MSRYQKWLLMFAALPLLTAAAINLYFVHAGWHGKIPGYLILWTYPCSTVLDSTVANLVDNFLQRHVAIHSLIPGIVVFIWMPAVIYSAILSVGAAGYAWIKSKLYGSPNITSKASSVLP
ncbi:MAG TPA: hypothetical protein VGN44_07810 [Candidatus Angelobacter sp.]|jgi:hypothetical protein